MDPNTPQFRKAGGGIPAPAAVPQGASQPAHPVAEGATAVPTSKVHGFFIKHTSSLTGRYYEGQFSCRKLSIKDFGRINVRKVQLNGGYYFDEERPGCGIDEQTDTIHNMIAHLEIALIQWPAWWDLEVEDDPTVLKVIYDEVVTWENSFLSRRDASRPGGGVSDDSSGKGPQSGSAGHVEAVVGGEVSPALEP
jgi:hypothetical protein